MCSQLDSLAHQVDSLRQLLGASPEGVRKMKARPPQTIQSESNPSIGDHAASPPVSETQSLEADDIFGLQAASSNLDQVIPSHLGNVEFSSEAFLTLFNLYVLYKAVVGLLFLYPIVFSNINITTCLYSTPGHPSVPCRRTRLYSFGQSLPSLAAFTLTIATCCLSFEILTKYSLEEH